MQKKRREKQLELINKQEQEMLNLYGWYVHYVTDFKELRDKGMANIHTHGVSETFNHLDIQVVLPLSPEIIHPVLVKVVERIQMGETFEEHTHYRDIFFDKNVCFVIREEGGRQVLRMLIPDSNGRFPFEEGCEKSFVVQIEEIKY